MGNVLYLSEAEAAYRSLPKRQQTYIQGQAMGYLAGRDFWTICGYLTPQEREAVEALILEARRQLDGGRTL